MRVRTVATRAHRERKPPRDARRAELSIQRLEIREKDDREEETQREQDLNHRPPGERAHLVRPPPDLLSRRGLRPLRKPQYSTAISGAAKAALQAVPAPPAGFSGSCDRQDPGPSIQKTPSSPNSFFQIGARALTSSITQAQAASAW